jgi:TolB-like protein/Flp pilus assembly protein TadD/DNA-binding winged helix-turn-helix (wHTH) protein
MDIRLQRGFRVGEYDVRPLEGRIIGPTGSQHVQPKVMEVLLCLAECAGDLVERETLIERAWGGAAGSDDVLTRCISELRQHLDDHHDSVQYIQTVPKRGYRLVATVEFADSGSLAPAAEVTEGVTSQAANGDPSNIFARFWADLKRRNVVRVSIAYIVVAWVLLQVGETVFEALRLPEWSLTLLLAMLVIGFPVAVILAWIFQVTPEGVIVDVTGAPPGPIALRRHLDILIIGALVIAVAIMGYRLTDDDDPPGVGVAEQTQLASIAVLRFLNIGGLPHFADGLGEELLDRLAKLNELGVAARTSSWSYAEKNVDVPTIAAQLSVDYVLEGSVRQSGDRIRITAQLNDGATGKHVWSQSYDRELTTENFFETQSEIARQVVNLLQISLSPESEAMLTEIPKTSLQALELYLKGQDYFRMPHSDESLDTAADYFRHALEVDPRFAMAYAGLCDTQQGKYTLTRDVEDFEEAERACHRALTLDEDMPRVLAALGGLYLFSGQSEKAEQVLRRALAASPNEIDAYADLAEALQNQQRSEEAEAVLVTMIARQPGYWYAHNALGNFLYRESRYDEALKAFSGVTDRVPDKALGYNNVGIAHYMLGDYAAASRAYEMSVAIEPYVDNYTNLGLAYFYAGEFEKAAEMQQKAADLRPDDARVLGRLATARYFGGRADEANVLFEKTIGMLEEQLVINPNDVRLNRYLAVFNATVGRLDESRAAIERALALQPESSGVRYDAAKVALLTGDVEAALNYLDHAKKLGYSANIIRSDPVFNVLHQDARFQTIANNNEQGAGQ